MPSLRAASTLSRLSLQKLMLTLCCQIKKLNIMNKKSNKKVWRENVIITYYNPDITSAYRSTAVDMITGLALFHSLEFATSYDIQFYSDSDLSENKSCTCIFDLIYFRSTSSTQVTAKEFRNIVHDMFYKLPTKFFCQFDVCTQIHSFLLKYPFPN